MSESSQRQAWAAYDGQDSKMVPITFGPARFRVAAPTVDAWRALESVLDAHNYQIRSDTYGFAARNIKGTGVRSLHAYGLAVDVNAQTNPLKETPNRRKVKFSSKPTQRQRGEDVTLAAADTDMTPEMIADIRAIRTNNGKQVFEWGGNWNTRKDAMHFYVDVPPADLATGIDPDSVKGAQAGAAEASESRADESDVWSDVAQWLQDNWSGGPDVATGFDNLAPKVMAQLIADFDLSPEQAAGIVGNLGAESNLAAIQEARPISGRGGFGWAQWTGPRRVSYERWCQANGLSITSSEANYGYLKAELCGGVPGNDYRDTIRKLKQTSTLREAVESFERTYERAGIKRMDARIRFAERALRLYRETQPAAADFPIAERPSGIPPEIWDILKVVLGQVRQKPVIRAQTREEVEYLQRRLTELNYHTGGIDGIFGPLTKAAVAAFQADNDLDGRGQPTAETLSLLMSASARPLPTGRVAVTADDLRQRGSIEIKNADRARYAGWASGLLGVLGLGNSALGVGAAKPVVASGAGPEAIAKAFIDNRAVFTQIFGTDFGPMADRAQQFLNTARGAGASTALALPDILVPIINSFLPGVGGSAAAIAIGLATHIFGTNVINRRVENQRNGSHIGVTGL